MRERSPERDQEDFVIVDGVRLGYEVFGHGGPAMFARAHTDHRPRPLLKVPDSVPATEAGPVLLVHGTCDRSANYDVAPEATRSSGNEMLSIVGGDHLSMIRDPVRFNMALRDFAERVAS